MKKKIKDLSNNELDFVVAQILGHKRPEVIICPTCKGDGEVTEFGYGTINEHAQCPACEGRCTMPTPAGYKWWPAYSTDWTAGGAILEERRIDTVYCEVPDAPSFWLARIHKDYFVRRQTSASTKLRAGIECLALYVLGGEVELPEVLS